MVFQRAGGQGTFLKFNLPGGNGHFVLRAPELWEGPVAEYLSSLADGAKEKIGNSSLAWRPEGRLSGSTQWRGQCWVPPGSPGFRTSGSHPVKPFAARRDHRPPSTPSKCLKPTLSCHSSPLTHDCLRSWQFHVLAVSAFMAASESM
jgi:hypothetical protein